MQSIFSYYVFVQSINVTHSSTRYKEYYIVLFILHICTFFNTKSVKDYMKQEIAFLICMFDISEVNKIFRTTEQRLIYLHKYQFHQFGKKRCINEIDLERWLWWLIIMEKLIFKLLQMHLYNNIEYYCWFILLYAIQLYSNISKIYSTCDK